MSFFDEIGEALGEIVKEELIEKGGEVIGEVFDGIEDEVKSWFD